MSGEQLADPLAPGTRLGVYRIEKPIAEGGMAQVYEATHLDLMKRVAVKVLRASYASDANVVQRFVLEARAAARLQHPHVLGVADFGVERGRPYMVLDLLEGEDLGQRLARSGPMSPPRLVDLVLPVVSAMCAAHGEGILHRDLKPENVFVTRRRGREHPVVLDFGVSADMSARATPGRTLTRAGEAVGTPFYMSPEQVTGGRDLDGRSDQYSIGVLLYECATGALPYQAPTLYQLLGRIVQGGAPAPSMAGAALTPEMDAVVMRAMATSRDERYPTMRDFGRALWPYAGPVAQAIWAEEFGDPDALGGRVSSPPQRTETGVRAPSGGTELVVRPEDLAVFEAFESLPAASLEAFLRATRGRLVRAGATIVRQGAAAHACFLLLSGEVDVIKTATDGGSWILGRLSPGSIFGQISLVDHVPRTASIVAAEEARVIEVDRDVFEAMLARTDDVAQALREQVARSGIRQLRRATKRLASLLRGPQPGPARDPRRELVYLQAAASEWSLPIDEEH